MAERACDWRGIWKDKEYNLDSLEIYLGISRPGTCRKIRRFQTGKITLEKLFNKRWKEDRPEPEIDLKEPYKGKINWKCSEIVEESGCGPELIMNRIRAIRYGDMKEESLFMSRQRVGNQKGHTAKKGKWGHLGTKPRLSENVLDMSPEEIEFIDRTYAKGKTGRRLR